MGVDGDVRRGTRRKRRRSPERGKVSVKDGAKLPLIRRRLRLSRKDGTAKKNRSALCEYARCVRSAGHGCFPACIGASPRQSSISAQRKTALQDTLPRASRSRALGRSYLSFDLGRSRSKRKCQPDVHLADGRRRNEIGPRSDRPNLGRYARQQDVRARGIAGLENNWQSQAVLRNLKKIRQVVVLTHN